MEKELEFFKPIIGYEGRYEISNYGIVKSCAKEWLACGNRKVHRKKGDSILCTMIHNDYPRATLTDCNGIKKTYSVHRLVALNFIDNPNNYPIVNHLDSNRSNNYYKNLEWTTYKGNAIHAFENGNRKGRKGESNPQSRYRDRDIRIIRKLAADGFYSQEKIAKMFEDNQSNIGRIILRQRWKHIL
jgi:hypothetical protein